jgi:hypothetical protein
MRQKAGIDGQVPALVETAVSSAVFRRNWARLIQKIYEIDPLLCPKCLGPMKVLTHKHRLDILWFAKSKFLSFCSSSGVFFKAEL